MTENENCSRYQRHSESVTAADGRWRGRLSPIPAHLCHAVTLVIASAAAWNLHILESRHPYLGTAHYAVFLLPIVVLGRYVWHCFIKKDYVWLHAFWG